MRAIFAFLAGIVIAFGAYFSFNPKAFIGMSTETRSVSEVVNEIKELNRIIVFQTYTTAIVESHEYQAFGLFDSHQVMVVPAFVNYYIDMEKLHDKDININRYKRTVSVKLPPLMIERPNVDLNRIRKINQGVLSDVTDADKRLEVRNNRIVVARLMASAKQQFLLDAARKQAIQAIENNFATALRGAGHEEFSVVATF